MLLLAPSHLAVTKERGEKPRGLGGRCYEEMGSLTCYWLESDHMTASDCKGGWEM